jgi:cell division protein FtsB
VTTIFHTVIIFICLGGYWLMVRLETNRLLKSIDNLKSHVQKAEAEYEAIRRRQMVLEQQIRELGQ